MSGPFKLLIAGVGSVLLMLFGTAGAVEIDPDAIFQSVRRSKDDALLKALSPFWPLVSDHLPRLKWNQRVALMEGDYVLCLFDDIRPLRAYPGDNPRVLILFSLDYEIKTWGQFSCEPPFEYGTMIDITFGRKRSDRFVTVNLSPRNGQLWFERYRITPEKIEKIGEGAEYPVVGRKP